MSRYGHGLVIGSFYPLHAGHEHLIAAAASECARVTVQVLAASAESIPLAVRMGWLRERFPMLTVVGAVDDSEVDFGSPSAWDAHMSVITGLLDGPVDVVFTSDDYGAELARRLDAAWEQVDEGHRFLRVSADAVREDIAGHWWALPPVVREWFCRRVVVLGTERTGSTALAQDLADYYGTLWVPPYGRTWGSIRSGGPDAPWHTAEFDLIATEHQRQERAAMRSAPRPLIISETDAFTTMLCHERVFAQQSESVRGIADRWVPDLYLLTGEDLAPLASDPADGQHPGCDLQREFRERLAARGVPWVEVRGSRAQRLAEACRAIDEVLAAGWGLDEPAVA